MEGAVIIHILALLAIDGNGQLIAGAILHLDLAAVATQGEGLACLGFGLNNNGLAVLGLVQSLLQVAVLLAGGLVRGGNYRPIMISEKPWGFTKVRTWLLSIVPVYT